MVPDGAQRELGVAPRQEEARLGQGAASLATGEVLPRGPQEPWEP